MTDTVCPITELSDPAVVPAIDGVICFGGEDWWYHNRGHYDLQMMREFSASLPVLYVNSIGMRTPRPREGRMFFVRMRRKMRSIRRGLVRVDDRFWVLSPFVVPGRLGGQLTNPVLISAVRRAARRLGITRPLLWIACPPAAGVRTAIPAAATVYQRTDRYESFPAVDADRIRACDRALKSTADLTVFCARSLFDQERNDCRRAILVDHGVDIDRFTPSDRPAPDDIASLAGPRIGFVGSIDAHTLDPDLVNDVARRIPDATFILIGPCSLPAGWCTSPNVVQLGQRPFASVPRYLTACDALIMPWRRSPWIDSCHPVKLKEYLASGRPIVSTPFRELDKYTGLVHAAADADSFADALRTVLEDGGDAAARRACVEGEGWSRKADTIATAVIGAPISALAPRPAPVATLSRTRTPDTPAQTEPSLAACVLLAGGLTPSPIVAALGRSILDLWIAPDRTVLSWWLHRLRELEAAIGQSIPLRIVHDSATPSPWPDPAVPAHVLMEREPRGLRGPAGVVRDVCHRYDSEQHVLVAEAARLLETPIEPLVRAHAQRGADVTIAVNRDGAPSGLYVIRCRALHLVPLDGFMDIKEQWLPRVQDAGGDAAVHRLSGRGALPLRSRRDVLDAARSFGRDGPADLPARVVCQGAKIGPGAIVLDALVMPGAVIGAGAVVVRSIVGPDAEIPPHANVAGVIATATDAHRFMPGGAHAA